MAKTASFALLVLLVGSATLVIANPLAVDAASCTTVYSPGSPPAQQLTISSPGTYCFDAGTYNTQITITASNVVLTGAPGTTASLVAIRPTNVTSNAVDPVHRYNETAIIYADGGLKGVTGIAVEGLTVDGSIASSSATSCGSASVRYYVGILYSGASGTITNTQVTPPPPPPPVTAKTATAAAILPDLTYVANATYGVGEDIQISTVVPAGTDPASIQGFNDGAPGEIQGWNVAETNYNYIIDTGSTTAVGNHIDYTQVTFADGTVVRSNDVHVTVQSAPVTVAQASAGPYACRTNAGLGVVVGTPSAVASTVLITQNTVTNYQKSGIVCWEAGTTCIISDNDVSPLPAAESLNAPNGIQLTYGGTGTITGNSVSGNKCDISGVCGPDLVDLQQSCGVMTYKASPGVSITGNQVSTNDIGICLGVDAGTISSTGNNVNASTYAGVEVYDESQTVVGNSISNSQYGVVPISDNSTYLATVGYFDTFTAVATDCYAITQSPGVATCVQMSSSLGPR